MTRRPKPPVHPTKRHIAWWVWWALIAYSVLFSPSALLGLAFLGAAMWLYFLNREVKWRQRPIGPFAHLAKEAEARLAEAAEARKAAEAERIVREWQPPAGWTGVTR